MEDPNLIRTLASLSPEQLKISEIFFPHAFERTKHAVQSGIRFAHYSSAEAAMKMLASEEVWMRKSAAMNDFREIDYGRELLNETYKGEAGDQLKAILEEMYPGICREIEKLFDGWYPHFVANTYLTCISEHDPDEDHIGRLSMWRAYGGATGVAVILKGAPFIAPTDALQAYTSPVAYLSRSQFVREFHRLHQNIVANREFVQGLGKPLVLNMLFDVFRAATVCTKHPGFHEEREWRVVYNPAWKKSERIIASAEIIRGVPQMVQKIPLKDLPEEGLVGITIPDIIDRVIIGPTNFPWEIREALISLLEGKGLENAAQKVVISDIPLRNS
ncbi:DUF2971 domain-containing protein [Mesorhizobium sp. 10J20-29]